jgi:DNA repair photolyase
MKITQKVVKQIITKSNLPAADFVINPYIGCCHSCIYCYADFMKRFTGHAGEKWGDFVDIKINAHETIKNKKIIDKSILLGSVTDPYQAVEAKYKMTQKILEKLVLIQPNLEILTKSKLILRDIELLKQFTNLRIGISLNTTDDSISKHLEPHASPATSRINTLRVLHNAGLKTFLFISPIFPEITDFKELIESTHSFVDKFYFENLNIRANNRSAIYGFIKKNYPNLTVLYNELKPNCIYWDNLKKQIIHYCDSRSLKYQIYFDHAEERKN